MPEFFDEEYEAIIVPAPAGGVRRGEFILVNKLGGVAEHGAEEGEEA